MATVRNYQSNLVSKPAGEDLSASQYMQVKLMSDDTIDLCDAITDIVYGVLQNDPEAGATAVVAVADESFVVAGAALANGAIVGPATTGKIQTAVATQYPSGIVVSPSGADKDLAVIEIIHSGVVIPTPAG